MPALVQFAAPATEPLTLAEVRERLRFDDSNAEAAPPAPACALAGAGAGGVDNGAHRYLATFVTAAGETDAGTSSTVVTVADKTVNGKVALSAIPLGGSAVLARKLYRTLAGGSVFYLLTTLNDNSTQTYTDTTADAALGVGAPAINTTTDPRFNMLIASACRAAETLTRRALITQTWDLFLDSFPGWELTVPKPMLQSIDSISYVDTNGVQQTLDPTLYLVDTAGEPGRITPVYGRVWPWTRWQMNAVKIRYTCGYGDANAVPQGIKDWMLVRIATLLENPAAIVVDQRIAIAELPNEFVDGLLDPYRVDNFSWAVGV